MTVRDRIRADVRAVLDRDPATGSALEAVLTSPGLWALWSHRLATSLRERGHRLLAGVLSTLARLVTGVEIHPGADVGERVVIDHGQGVVIGETASVGDDVLLYHGVTLGAKHETTGQRHPTVGDDVTLGANATVLGDVTVGDGATVGAAAVVLEDVAPGQTVAGVPAEPVDGHEDDAVGAESLGAAETGDVGEAASAADGAGADSDAAGDETSDAADGTDDAATEAVRPAPAGEGSTADDADETTDQARECVCEVGGGW